MLKKGKESCGNFARLQKLATYKFRRLRIFATCKISQHYSPNLLLFDPPFLWFYTSFPSCNFGSLAHFCNFLILSTYISSFLLLIKSTFSLHQSIRLARSFLLSGFVIFSPFLLFSCIFLVAKHPLDDDKPRDARLKPLDP